MEHLKIKPLSVNECWQGKRFKTDKYLIYEKELLYLLPKKEYKNPYRLVIYFGVSSKLADIDNPVKPFLDILQKKYNFNDKEITQLTVNKLLVNKGEEFIAFELFEK